MAISSRTVMPTTFKGICDNYGRLHPHFARTGAVLPYYRFGYNQKGNQENGHIILLFLGLNCSCWVESKRSRSWSRSRYFQAGVGVGAGVARNPSTPQPWSRPSLLCASGHDPQHSAGQTTTLTGQVTTLTTLWVTS